MYQIALVISLVALLYYLYDGTINFVLHRISRIRLPEAASLKLTESARALILCEFQKGCVDEEAIRCFWKNYGGMPVTPCDGAAYTFECMSCQNYRNFAVILKENRKPVSALYVSRRDMRIYENREK